MPLWCPELEPSDEVRHMILYHGTNDSGEGRGAPGEQECAQVPGDIHRRRPPVDSETQRLRYWDASCEAASKDSECPHGDDCPFAHTREEVMYHPARYLTRLCDYAKACKLGKKCCYAHESGELRKFAEDRYGWVAKESAVKASPSPDLVAFKTEPCTLAHVHDRKLCASFHSPKDRRRIDTSSYSSKPCAMQYDLDHACCRDRDACPHAHNRMEVLYHPKVLKQRFCATYPNVHTCRRGSLCAFAHSKDELAAPTFDRDEETKRSDEFFMYKFKTLWCPHGVQHDWHRCVYAHTYQDCRRVPEIGYGSEPCPDWDRNAAYKNYEDRCPRGFRCPRAHGSKEQLYHPAYYKAMPCSDFKTGNTCPRGELCAFFHHTEQQRELKKQPNYDYTVPLSDENMAAMTAQQPFFTRPPVFSSDDDRKKQGQEDLGVGYGLSMQNDGSNMYDQNPGQQYWSEDGSMMYYEPYTLHRLQQHEEFARYCAMTYGIEGYNWGSYGMTGPGISDRSAAPMDALQAPAPAPASRDVKQAADWLRFNVDAVGVNTPTRGSTQVGSDTEARARAVSDDTNSSFFASSLFATPFTASPLQQPAAKAPDFGTPGTECSRATLPPFSLDPDRIGVHCLMNETDALDETDEDSAHTACVAGPPGLPTPEGPMPRLPAGWFMEDVDDQQKASASQQFGGSVSVGVAVPSAVHAMVVLRALLESGSLTKVILVCPEPLAPPSRAACPGWLKNYTIFSHVAVDEVQRFANCGGRALWSCSKMSQLPATLLEKCMPNLAVVLVNCPGALNEIRQPVLALSIVADQSLQPPQNDCVLASEEQLPALYKVLPGSKISESEREETKATLKETGFLSHSKGSPRRLVIDATIASSAATDECRQLRSAVLDFQASCKNYQPHKHVLLAPFGNGRTPHTAANIVAEARSQLVAQSKLSEWVVLRSSKEVWQLKPSFHPGSLGGAGFELGLPCVVSHCSSSAAQLLPLRVEMQKARHVVQCAHVKNEDTHKELALTPSCATTLRSFVAGVQRPPPDAVVGFSKRSLVVVDDPDACCMLCGLRGVECQLVGPADSDGRRCGHTFHETCFTGRLAPTWVCPCEYYCTWRSGQSQEAHALHVTSEALAAAKAKGLLFLAGTTDTCVRLLADIVKGYVEVQQLGNGDVTVGSDSVWLQGFEPFVNIWAPADSDKDLSSAHLAHILVEAATGFQTRESIPKEILQCLGCHNPTLKDAVTELLQSDTVVSTGIQFHPAFWPAQLRLLFLERVAGYCQQHSGFRDHAGALAAKALPADWRCAVTQHIYRTSKFLDSAKCEDGQSPWDWIAWLVRLRHLWGSLCLVDQRQMFLLASEHGLDCFAHRDELIWAQVERASPGLLLSLFNAVKTHSEACRYFFTNADFFAVRRGFLPQ